MTLWGPYLSERQWGTVREDYSADGNAWEYLPHDMARSRAYRWGEDGLAGICDKAQTHFGGNSIFSMPDKWEYPWFAAWDLAFHTVTFSLIDAEFAKQQLLRLAHPWYMHPNGQVPAYEWNVGDTNPPVQAWAAWRVFQIDRKKRRAQNRNDSGDLVFLKRAFLKLLLNFT
jgi:hypothetical protein